MAKIKIWARMARATFNGISIGSLAGWSVYGLLNAVAKLGATIADPVGSGALIFFTFLIGSIGIELSKDIEATEKEAATAK